MIDVGEKLRLWIWEQIDKHKEDLIAVQPTLDLILNKIDEFKDENQEDNELKIGQRVLVERDGFLGDIIGFYTTREGKKGVVLQQKDTKIVHVYQKRWINAGPT